MANLAVSQEKLSSNLPQLQNLCKRDPETYREEFLLQLEHFESKYEIFKLQQGKASADFIALVTFLSQCSACYPQYLKEFPQRIIDLLNDKADILERQLRLKLVQNLVLIRNRGQLDAMPFFTTCFQLFRLQDKQLRQVLFNALVSDVQNTNIKKQNRQFNRELKTYMRKLILGEEPLVGRKTLDVLIELYKKRIWNDQQTVNIVADGCFAKEMKICVASLRFFLGIENDIAKEDEKEEEDYEDYGFSKSMKIHQHSKKTKSRIRHNNEVEKKKKKMRQRKAMGGKARKPLLKAIELVRDPQSFAEKLFRVLRSLKKIRFEEKLMFMDLISRLIGVHHVILLNFYSYLQNYLSAHQVEITRVLAILLQACHEQVTEDSIIPIVRTIADNFVRDRCGPEVITIGINAITGIFMRVSHVLNSSELRALVSDLSMFKKSRDKSVVVATRGFINVIREHHPALLKKKDRGREHNPNSKPLAYGEQRVADKETLQKLEEQRKEKKQAERLGIDVATLRKHKALKEAARIAAEKKEAEPKPWTCSECDSSNFPARPKCFSCGAKKVVEDAGEGSDSDSDDDAIALGPQIQPNDPETSRADNDDGGDNEDGEDEDSDLEDLKNLNHPQKGRRARRNMKRKAAEYNIIGSDHDSDEDDLGLDDVDFDELEASGSESSSDDDDGGAGSDDEDPTGLGGLFVHESQLIGHKARVKITREERALKARAGMNYTKTRGGGSTNTEKKRKKAFVMIKYSRAVRAKLKTDLQHQQKAIKDRMKAIERAGSKKIKRGRR